MSYALSIICDIYAVMFIIIIILVVLQSRYNWIPTSLAQVLSTGKQTIGGGRIPGSK